MTQFPAAEQLLADLRAAGVEVVATGAGLRIRAKRGVMTLKLQRRVKEVRAEIIQLARASHPCAECARFAFPTSTVICFWCRRRMKLQSGADGRHRYGIGTADNGRTTGGQGAH